MGKKNIVIAGGGFSGVSALKRFKRHKCSLNRDFNVILIDRKPYFEFLPMLPDVAGGWMRPELLRYDLASFAENSGADFIKGGITGIAPSKKVIKVENKEIDYEYAVIATGSQTNFYGNGALRDACLKLDDVNDAVLIKETLLRKEKTGEEMNILVVGGGYTGVEIATNMDLLLRKRRKNYRVYIVERADEILMMVPGWIRRRVKNELNKLGIEVLCGEALKEISGKDAILASGKIIDKTVCIWAAGVKTSGFLETTKLEKERTRIIVNEQLQTGEASYKDVFIAGDSAFFMDKSISAPLRMAVMFSMGQGKTAAENIVNSIRKKPLKKYDPLDLGYIVPMAHGRATGMIMGQKVYGPPAYFMHYLMCAYRSEWKNRTGILKDLVLKSRKKEGG